MKEYEIYWSDLTSEAQDRLKEIYHDNIELSPLASFEIEDADLNDDDYDGPTNDVTLFYRDGANYKFTEVFKIPTARLESLRHNRNRKEAFYEQEDALIAYDYDLGISREDFHDTLGTSYNDSYDHNFVIIQEIDGKPNTDPDAEPEHDFYKSSVPALPFVPPHLKPKPK